MGKSNLSVAIADVKVHECCLFEILSLMEAYYFLVFLGDENKSADVSRGC